VPVAPVARRPVEAIEAIGQAQKLLALLQVEPVLVKRFPRIASHRGVINGIVSSQRLGHLARKSSVTPRGGRAQEDTNVKPPSGRN